MGFEVDFQNGPPVAPGAARMSIDAPYRRLAVRRWNVDRGRQYELDQIQAGTLSIEVHDPLELLNPDNTGSPFNTGANSVIPYRGISVWAMWPNQPGAGNLINTAVDTGYDPSFELNPFGFLGYWAAVGGTTTLAQSTAQHFNGTKALLVTQSAAGSGFGVYNYFSIAPSLTYTFSAYVFPTAGCAVTVQAVDASGGVHAATSTTTSAWQRLTVTWNCVDAIELVTIYGTGVTTPIFYVDATMLEFGAAANTFTTTGPTLYPQYTGYVERWPTQYTLNGMLATRPLTAVDALAVLSRTAISQSYEQTIAPDLPTVYIPWSNTAQAVSGGKLGSDALAQTNSTFVVAGVQGNPHYLLAPNGSIEWTGDQQPDSTPALVLSQQNANNPPTAGGSNQDTSVDVYNAQLSFDTVNGGMIECWAKPVIGQMIFGMCFAADVGLDTNFSGFTGGNPRIGFLTAGNGAYIEWLYDPTGSAPVIFKSIYPDGEWHYFAITISSGSMILTVDGADSAPITVSTPGRIGFTYMCHVSANCGFGDPQSQLSFGRWAFYNNDLPVASRLAHYNRGVGYVNELAGVRVARLLALYWAGAYTVANGYLQMANDFSYDTTAINTSSITNGVSSVTSGGGQQRVMLDVLQEIQESERGLIYADRSGTVIFEDRASRYTNGQTALWVLGENPAGSSPVEYPYADYQPDYDPTYTFSQANLTSLSNGTFAPIINPVAQAKYGQRILTQQVQCNTDYDLWQAGIFYLTRYGSTKTRIAKLTLRPSSNPAMWPMVLSLELSRRITVRRRNASLTVSADYYVEKISPRVDSDSGDWTVDLQLSPVFVPSAWLLGDSTYGILGQTTTPIY
jgi:hypothetical protein